MKSAMRRLISLLAEENIPIRVGTKILDLVAEIVDERLAEADALAAKLDRAEAPVPVEPLDGGS